MYCTVKINTHDSGGKMTGSGTGFYFDYLSANGRVISVVNDGKAMPSGVCEHVVINNIQNEWVFHPDPLVVGGAR